MALSVQSLDLPFAQTQRYKVTGTVGDLVTVAVDDDARRLVVVSPISATMTAAGIIFAATQVSADGGAAPLVFTDTTDGETVSVTVNMAGDPVATPDPITGQVGQVIAVSVTELNDPNAFASFAIEDTTIATLAVSSNAEGAAQLLITLLKNGSTALDVDDGHGGTPSFPILVGLTTPVKNVTISAGEAMVGGAFVPIKQTVVPLQDTSTGYNGPGGYTVSLKNDGTFVVTEGIPPAESTSQINLVSAVVMNTGYVGLTDARTLQVTVQAVNSTIMASANVDGSYLVDATVTVRTLSQAVLDMFGTTQSGAEEPTNPHQGETFFNTTTDVFEIYLDGAWVTIATVGGGGSGVASLNALTGALAIAGGPGIGVAASGSTITISRKGSTTTARSTVAASLASVALLAANAARVAGTIFNDQSGGGTATLYVAVGASGSTSDFTVELGPGQSFDLPAFYTGTVYGAWDAASGSARITEYT